MQIVSPTKGDKMTDQEIIEKINSLVASQSILQHLTLALFDAIEDKTRVIKQFDETTAETYRLLLGSQTKEFLSAFDEHRKAILKSLAETKAEIGPHNGVC
jgi:hypothetical protein